MKGSNEKKEKLTPFGDDHVHLLYAYSGASNELIKIDKAYVGGEYQCPLCGKPVVPNLGSIRRNSFKHKKGTMSCFPQSSMIDKFIINLAIELFVNYKRITTPARSYRIKKRKFCFKKVRYSRRNSI